MTVSGARCPGPSASLAVVFSPSRIPPSPRDSRQVHPALIRPSTDLLPQMEDVREGLISDLLSNPGYRQGTARRVVLVIPGLERSESGWQTGKPIGDGRRPIILTTEQSRLIDSRLPHRGLATLSPGNSRAALSELTHRGATEGCWRDPEGAWRHELPSEQAADEGLGRVVTDLPDIYELLATPYEVDLERKRRAGWLDMRSGTAKDRQFWVVDCEMVRLPGDARFGRGLTHRA